MLRVLKQAGDLLLAEVGAALDAHALLTTGGAIGGRHLQEAVGIDVEGHLHLRHPAGSGGDAGEAKAPEAFVARRHLPLALEHMNLHGTLVHLRGAEDIALAHGNGGVARDQHLHHPADGLQPEGEGGDVVEHQVAQFAGENAGLHCSTDGHHLIGVHRLTGLTWDQRAHHLLHHRHAGGAPHQHDIVDVFRCEAGITEGALHGPQQAIEQIGTEGLEAAPFQAGFDVQGAVGTGRDEGQGDGGGLHTAELDLGLLGCLAQALQGLAIAAQVKAVALLKGIGQPVDDAAIPVVATELGVTAGGLHIEDTIGDAQHRHIKGATAQVEHQDALAGAAVEAIGQGRGGGFVENAFHGDAREAPGVAGGLALRVVEVGRNGDHRRFHRFAQVGGGIVHQFAQDAGHQLLGGVLTLGDGAHHPHLALVVGAHRVRHGEAALLQLLPLPAHKPLQVGEGVAGIEHQLTAGQLPDEQLLLTAVTHHRRCGASALGAGDHLRPAAFEDGHHRVGGAQVYANDPPHDLPLRSPKLPGTHGR